jgi:hypothetical protein
MDKEEGYQKMRIKIKVRVFIKQNFDYPTLSHLPEKFEKPHLPISAILIMNICWGPQQMFGFSPPTGAKNQTSVPK